MKVYFLKAKYTLSRVYEFLPLPKIPGVLVVLLYEDRILLVRHTYGKEGWFLPGGLRPWFRSAHAQANDEIKQELGIEPPQLKFLGKVVVGARKIDLFLGELTDFRGIKKGPEIETYGFHREHELVELSQGTLHALTLIGWAPPNQA